jgi:copper chaperone CopZ
MKEAKEMRLSVSGMTCGSCVMHVTRALEDLEGVDDVQVLLREGEARVVYDPAASGAEEFIKALAEEGYDAKVLPASSKSELS